ncbi:MAG: ABC transporter substrate-binding protein [Nitrososphaerota archaeon]
MYKSFHGVGKIVAIVSIIIALIIGLIAGYFVSLSLAPPSLSTVTVAQATVTTTSVKTITVTSTVGVAPERIVIGVTDKVSDIDPANAYDFYTWEVLTNIMGGLMRYTPGTTELEPGLAISYTVSPDGKEYTFKLRPNLYFADGKKVTAHDVVRSIKRVMKINGDPAWLVTDFVEDAVALDDYTVKFILIEPVSYFPALVATPPYFPVHPAYKPEEIDSDQTAGGVGPYKIVKWVRDVELVLEANPYWWEGAPKTKQIVVRFYKDATSLRLALEAGEIDVAWRTLRPTDIQDLKGKAGIKVIEVPGAFIRYIIFNTRIPPFDNELVRKALAAAINRKAICDKIFLGTVEPLYSMIPKGMWSHKESFLEKYGEYNVELAKTLLRQAGYSETNKLKIELWYTPTHYGDTEVDVAMLIKEAWEGTGIIEVELKSAEWTTYLDYTRKGLLGASLYGWYPDYIDPDDYTSPWVNTSWTGYAYSNPRLMDILREARTKPTIEERTRLYEQAQDIWAEDAAIVPLFQGKLTIATKEGIEGVILDPVMLFRYWLIYKT